MNDIQKQLLEGIDEILDQLKETTKDEIKDLIKSISETVKSIKIQQLNKLDTSVLLKHLEAQIKNITVVKAEDAKDGVIQILAKLLGNTVKVLTTL